MLKVFYDINVRSTKLLMTIPGKIFAFDKNLPDYTIYMCAHQRSLCKIAFKIEKSHAKYVYWHIYFTCDLRIYVQFIYFSSAKFDGKNLCLDK